MFNKLKYLNLKKVSKNLTLVFFFLAFVIILFSACVSLYANKGNIKNFITKTLSYKYQIKKSYNPKNISTDRFLPPLTNKILKKTITDLDLLGRWSAPFDWPVVSIHLLLLPNGNVMSYGSFSADIKKDQGAQIKKNKEIILSNNKKLNRDAGGVQWEHLEVFSGIDFDIWNPVKGVGADSHHTIKKPIVLDAFCSIARLYNLDTLFVLGGNKYRGNSPDSTKRTVFYDVKTKKFKAGKNLNHARWYGSIVRWNDELVMFGGIHNTKGTLSLIPEILKKDSKGEFYWKELPLGESAELFGNTNEDNAGSYPKTYLAPDGNIFGISYNKMWSFNPDSGKPIMRTGTIPLEKGMKVRIIDEATHEAKHSEDKDKLININDSPNNLPNRMMDHKKTTGLLTGTIGASVGNKATSVMIEDKIYMMGGNQVGYVASNHLNRIDISDTFNPKVERLSPMHIPRAYGNSLILPNGNIFVSGGQYINNNLMPHDQRFAAYNAEIYDVQSDTWKLLPKASIPRNYHNSALLLLDGSVLVTGGDSWNAEIYYPDYLMEQGNEGNMVLAKKPILSTLAKNYKIGDNIEFMADSDISSVSLISAGSTTHSQGVELKYFNLKFDKKNDKIIAKLPDNRKTLQKGVYILFAINVNGAPSQGQTLMIN